MNWLILLTLTFCAIISTVAGDATADVITQETCGEEILRKKGITPWAFQSRNAVKFDNNQVFIEPKRPRIPGCFNLTAYNVEITKALPTLTVEFEMRFGDVPDPSVAPIQCRKRTDDSCPCGGNNYCMYCDFCKNIRSHVPLLTLEKEGRSKRQAPWGMGQQRQDVCLCKIEPGIYDIKAEICTPTAEELQKILPEAILALVGKGSYFTLWTTLSVYNMRFNDINPHLSPAARDLQMNAIRRAGLVGCHVIGTNVDVPV